MLSGSKTLSDLRAVHHPRVFHDMDRHFGADGRLHDFQHLQRESGQARNLGHDEYVARRAACQFHAVPSLMSAMPNFYVAQYSSIPSFWLLTSCMSVDKRR